MTRVLQICSGECDCLTDYDVRADGQPFLFIVSAPGNQLFPYAVVMDWAADIKK